MENPLQQSSSDSLSFILLSGPAWTFIDLIVKVKYIFYLNCLRPQIKFVCKQNYVKLANQGRQFVVNKITLLQNKIMFNFANQR